MGGAFWSNPGDLSYLTECQLPDSLSPASHPDDKRDGKQRCRCVCDAVVTRVRRSISSEHFWEGEGGGNL